ncbi:MAG: LdpA C-terminal domain-containing domain [Candidatus Gastranaerophilaceae bacterium]
MQQDNLALKNILDSKVCFKLVCGAGNENLEEIEKLVYVYSKAGCNIFDISANLDALKAAKRGLNRAGIKDNRFICISVGIKGDPHTNKAFINKEICKSCFKCEKICPQNAISNFLVDKTKCIGCSKCLSACNFYAIEMKSLPTDLNKVLPDLITEGFDCLEFHAISDKEQEVFDIWNTLNKLFNGFLSICIDRALLSNKTLCSRLKKMLSIRKDFTTIIQADGSPMSGGNDDYKTTLQSVATAELIQKENFPAYIILSGGTNSKTKELSKLCNVQINGIAIGSFARKIVKNYLHGNMNEEEAVKIAKNLVESTY